MENKKCSKPPTSMGPEDPPPLSAANRATLQKGISIKAGHHTHSQTQALQGLSQSDGLVPLGGGGQDGEEVISLAVEGGGLDPNCLVATPRTCQFEINMAGRIGKFKSLSEVTDDYIYTQYIIYIYIYICVCVCVYIFKMHFLGWLHLCSVPGKRMKKACLQLFGPSFTIFGQKQDVDPSMWVSKLCIQIIR